MTHEPITALLHRQAITDAIHTYCRGVDTIDVDIVAALFTEDCVVDYGPGLGVSTHGRDNIADRLRRGLPRFAATSHQVSNIEITFGDDDTSASSITYLNAWHRYPDGKPDAVLWARYHDRWVIVDGRWLIAERILRVAGQENFDVEWYPIGRRS